MQKPPTSLRIYAKQPFYIIANNSICANNKNVPQDTSRNYKQSIKSTNPNAKNNIYKHSNTYKQNSKQVHWRR
jgi:hypothetical protein